MVRTYGLTHIALAVRDVERTARFYKDVFGMSECYREEGRVDMTTPGRSDILTFNQGEAGAGESGGIAHFGFRLTTPDDIDAAVEEVKRAGGTILRQGEFALGFPYVYLLDPDGYEIEIWYE
jgi:catechol 2,3-dioxygenase-like lactoylglutathione lyase family enzyme